jgi:hypothetical protein
MLWEKQHAALHLASKEWLSLGRLKNVRRGELRVDPEGEFKPAGDTIRVR